MENNCQSSFHEEMAHAHIVPTISVSRSRRVSVSAPLRFTRTFSEDSLDSIERNGRKELRHKLQTEPRFVENQRLDLYLYECPHLGDVGRSNTLNLEPEQFKFNLKPKKTSGESSCPPSPTRKSLSEMIGLTSYQHKLLTQCWPNIYGTGPSSPFANRIYTVLCNKSSKARQLFAKADGVAVFSNTEDCTTNHSRLTVELVDSIIRNLPHQHNQVTNYIVELGRLHKTLRPEGLSTTVWDDFGDSLMECVRRFEPVRKHKELRRAWLAVIAYITDNLKQGQSLTRGGSNYELSALELQRCPATRKKSSPKGSP